MSLALAAYLGGVACYTGVLLTGWSSSPRLPPLGVVVLALLWPLSIAMCARDCGGGR